MSTLDRVEQILRAAPMPRTPEVRLQTAIALHLADHHIPFKRECRLNEGDIIDFLVDETCGLEVKVDGSLSEITRQVHRYVQNERVQEMLLVTTASRHRGVPLVLNGKRVRVLHLLQGAL